MRFSGGVWGVLNNLEKFQRFLVYYHSSISWSGHWLQEVFSLCENLPSYTFRFDLLNFPQCFTSIRCLMFYFIKTFKVMGKKWEKKEKRKRWRWESETRKKKKEEREGRKRKREEEKWQEEGKKGRDFIIYKIIILIAQLVKNPPAMQETPVWFLDQEDLLEQG